MCILCVASRWSRRIVTMLPWLIIPLIILWALSQLLPPGFRFEVTSPRLACVGVLLISLGWYELAMPKLSVWRAKRTALLRERRRIEAQEAAKWRKEATRRCRNCLSAYRDQTPGGGRFMCTVCGHISKRPILDVPGGADGLVPGGHLAGIPSTNVTGSAGSFLGSQSSRGWGGRGWPDRGGWVAGGRKWTSSNGWAPGGWGSGNGSWATVRSWTAAGPPYRGGGTAGGWTGSSYGGFFFGGESCVAGDPHQGGLFFALFQGLAFVFFGLQWVWRKIRRGERLGEDGGVNGNRRGGQRKGEDGGIPQGNRGDKARRKAEEKRQARLEREQLEADERRQREEVARLVEERRRLRDEKLEAEKESEREAAAEREREVRREREAERRRLEKVKEREKELAKEKCRDTDLEDSKKKKEKKESEKRNDGEKSGEVEKKGTSLHPGESKKATKGSRGASVDNGHKVADAGVKAGNGAGAKGGTPRYVGSVKVTSSGPSKIGVAHQNGTPSFWAKGLTGVKSAKGGAHSVPLPAAPGNSASEVPKGKSTDTSYSPWNRMPWTKVWPSKSNMSIPEDNVAPQTGASNMNGRTDLTNQNASKPSINGLSGSDVSDLSQVTVGVKQPSAAPSHTRSWQQRLFSNSNVVSQSPPSDVVPHHDYNKHDEAVSPPEKIPLETETTICFGHDLQGAPVSMATAANTVGPPVQLPPLPFVPMSPSTITTGMAGSVLTPVHGAGTGTTFISPPPLVPNPIAKPVQMPVHPTLSGPQHVPAPIQSPVLITSQNQSHVPQDQLPQILEPWGKPPLSLDDPTEVSGGDKWQMWNTPQVETIQRSSMPLNTWPYLNNGLLVPQQEPVGPLTQSLEPENHLAASLFSPHQLVGTGCTSVNSQVASVGNSQSLWATLRPIWDRPDSKHPPREFVDCITQEVMKDPVITADGHSYERAAIEMWLKTHDTSPITGEVLPATPGGYGMDVDKTLRPNHILRGQIIEYGESMARLVKGSMQESNRENSLSLGLGGSAWSAERPQFAGFYTGAQSVWSYPGSQNSVLPELWMLPQS